MDKLTHHVRCEEWTRIINECLYSGMNKTEWCKVKGISDKKFFCWQRILRNEAFIEQKQLSATNVKSEPPVAFVELKQAGNHSDASVFIPDIIIRNNGLVLKLSNSASPELLKLIGGLIHAK